VGDDITFLDPANYCTNLTDFVGRVQTASADEQYLYAVVDNSTKVELLAGRWETVESTKWVWHPISEITLTNAKVSHISSIGTKKMWIASDTASEDIYYITITTQYGNITGDTNYRFATGSYMITSWLHGGFQNSMKAYIKLTLTMGHTYDADIYFTVSYEKMGDSSWTTIGNFKGTATDRTETKYIPVDGSSNVAKSNYIRFKIMAVTNDTNKTPVLLNYNCVSVLYSTNRKMIECEVLVGDSINLKDGTKEIGQSATIKAAIDEARAVTYPFAFYPLDWASSADTVYVKLFPTITIPSADEKGRTTEFRRSLKLQVIPIS